MTPLFACLFVRTSFYFTQNLRFRLLTTEGSLLACAGIGEGDKHVAAALAGNIWMSYTRNAEALLSNDPLSLVMIQCMVSQIDI